MSIYFTSPSTNDYFYFFFSETPSFTPFPNLFTAPQPYFIPPPTNSPVFSASPFFSLVIAYSYVTFIIPINTMTTIANTIAPRRPNINQPATNAITESIVMWVHSIFMFVILIVLRFG